MPRHAGVQHQQLPGRHRHPATAPPRARLPVDEAAHRLQRFLEATIDLMQVLARACGHDHLNQFTADDLTTFDRDIAHLTGIAYGGVMPA